MPLVAETNSVVAHEVMIVRDVRETDLHSILAIHNDAIDKTTAIWDDVTVDLNNRRGWLVARQSAGYPVLACEVEGSLAGYASFADFRPWSGYRHSVEHSVYVAAAYRRRGVARLLLESLIGRAARLDKHAMIGGIEADNDASIALHTRLDLKIVGRLPQVGAKFERWLDLVFMARLLDDRATPPG